MSIKTLLGVFFIFVLSLVLLLSFYIPAIIRKKRKRREEQEVLKETAGNDIAHAGE